MMAPPTRVSRMAEVRSCLRTVSRIYLVSHASVSRTVGTYCTAANHASAACKHRERRQDSPPQAENFRLISIENSRNAMGNSPPQAENFRISRLVKPLEMLFFKGKTVFGRAGFSKFSPLPPPMMGGEFSQLPPQPSPHGGGNCPPSLSPMGGQFFPESLLPPHHGGEAGPLLYITLGTTTVSASR